MSKKKVLKYKQQQEPSDILNILNDDLLSEHEAADVIHVSYRTLQGWRLRKKGPTHIKIGSNVRYRMNDLNNFLTTFIRVVEPSETKENR